MFLKEQKICLLELMIKKNDTVNKNEAENNEEGVVQTSLELLENKIVENAPQNNENENQNNQQRIRLLCRYGILQ